MDTLNVIPTSLGKYQVRGVLGRGAMGTVYDGWDPAIGRRVAIKTVRLLEASDQEAQDAAARFRNEAQAAGRLSHPHIVSVYDFGEANDIAFIVMEFVEGRSLKDLLDAGERLPVGETVRIMGQVLAALQFSHDKGVIHRDIKPGNVMLDADGQAKLTDFGIARIESSVMTQAGTMLGTPAYMSPEQLMAQPVDARTDIYSAGVLLYQLLTGERPFDGGLPAIIHKAMNTVPPRPSEIAVTVPPELDRVVATAMARRPDDRYPNATAFARAMREAGDGSADRPFGADTGWDADRTLVGRPAAAVRHSSTVPPPLRSRRRSSRPALLGGVAAVALLLLAGGGAWLALRPGRAPEPVASQQAALSTLPEPAAGQPPVGMSVGMSAEPGRPAGAPATEGRLPAETAAEPAPGPALALNQPSLPAVQPAPASEPPVAAPGAALAPAALAPPGSTPLASAPGSTPPGPTPLASTAGSTPPGPTLPGSTSLGPTPLASAPGPTPPGSTPAGSTPLGATPPVPTELAMAVPNPQAIRDALTRLAASATCALPRFSVSDEGRVGVSGVVGATTAATLREAVQATARAVPLTWDTQTVEGPYCDVLDLIRPIAQPSSPFLEVTLADGVTRLKRHDQIRPVLKLPEFPAYVQVDYVSNDGSVGHLLPVRGAPARSPAAANATLRVADLLKDRLEVGPPFGTDMIVAIASSVPLFPPGHVRADEQIRTYLPALAAALEAAERRGAKVAGRVLVVETQGR